VSANSLNSAPSAEHLKQLIREVPDFPKPGINFYDITTLLKDKAGFSETISALRDHYRSTPIDIVVGIEARGYFFAPAIALALNAGFVPVRKPKKLPHKTISVDYELEYGTDQLEMHQTPFFPAKMSSSLMTFSLPVALPRPSPNSSRWRKAKSKSLGFVIELELPERPQETSRPRRLFSHSILNVQVTVPSFAKLNLDLRVLSKRPDGYHELRTIFQTVSLRDSLRIEFRSRQTHPFDLESSVQIADNLVSCAPPISFSSI
jgi:adenine phosphoribosyltransferase